MVRTCYLVLCIASMSVVEKEAAVDKKEEEKKSYKEAFDAFDWNRNGAIPTSVSLSKLIY